MLAKYLAMDAHVDRLTQLAVAGRVSRTVECVVVEWCAWRIARRGGLQSAVECVLATTYCHMSMRTYHADNIMIVRYSTQPAI